jgi:1,4-dihydroxy-2-naphthoyl-CoA hydrolase
MTFTYSYTYTVTFNDTDAAGVVYFANVLSFCHHAYEASLQASGINLQSFFRNPNLAVPIAEAQVKFLHPLFCGDLLRIDLCPSQVSGDTFVIDYQVWVVAKPESNAEQGRLAAQASSRHVAIEPQQRQRCALPAELQQWLQQSPSIEP